MWRFRSKNFFKNFLKISKQNFWNFLKVEKKTVISVLNSYNNLIRNHHADQKLAKFSLKTPKK